MQYQQPVRKIIHIDMDAFYASVEQRDDPALRGKPVLVGGAPNSRGVVAAASYEARKFGVRSAMPCAQAARLCPHAIFVPPRFPAYRAVSRRIMEIFLSYTDLVEPLSLDEAYLDVTHNKFGNPSATRIAEEIRAKIFAETSLTASAGVAPNKFLAKIASDMNKPNGLTVIPPERVEQVLENLPVRLVPGIGKVTEERMKSLNIETTRDLRALNREQLIELFGKAGGYYFRIARGEDDRPVEAHRERKSVGAEETFAGDIIDPEYLCRELEALSERVWNRLKEQRGRTVTLKVTYAGFVKITRARTLSERITSRQKLYDIGVDLLLNQTEVGARPIRLIGLAVSHFHEPETRAAAVQLRFPFAE